MTLSRRGPRWQPRPPPQPPPRSLPRKCSRSKKVIGNYWKATLGVFGTIFGLFRTMFQIVFLCVLFFSLCLLSSRGLVVLLVCLSCFLRFWVSVVAFVCSLLGFVCLVWCWACFFLCVFCCLVLLVSWLGWRAACCCPAAVTPSRGAINGN